MNTTQERLPSTAPERVPSQRARWPWLSLIPLGFGAWVPIYAGVKVRQRSWILLGLLWSALVIAGFIRDSAGGHSGNDTVAGMLLIFGWVGAIATSFVIRSSYERKIVSPLIAASDEAQQRIADRQRALLLARQQPALAQEMGIGRPDIAGATDAGLIDVNNAAVSALERLPGIDDRLATRIVEDRAQAGGFSSLEDLGATLDLSGDLVEALRGRVVFLPRETPSAG